MAIEQDKGCGEGPCQTGAKRGILNAVLFLLIGLAVVRVAADGRLIVLGLAAIPLVPVARGISVVGPLTFLSLGKLALKQKRLTTSRPGQSTMPDVARSRCGIALPLIDCASDALPRSDIRTPCW